jgi:hypothetical protein
LPEGKISDALAVSAPVGSSVPLKEERRILTVELGNSEAADVRRMVL